ncbi:hypothetical protein SCUP234_06427 [Seiridium cupressi]
MRDLGVEHLGDGEDYKNGIKELGTILSPEQIRIMHTIRARQMLQTEDLLNIDNFGTDIIDGLSPNLVRGALGLATPEHRRFFHTCVLAKIFGEGNMNAQKQPTEQKLSLAAGFGRRRQNASVMNTSNESNRLGRLESFASLISVI